MIQVKNKGKIKDYVYDISLDGSVCVASLKDGKPIIVSNTDGFNFKLPDTFRYTEDNPYIGKGLSRETKEGKAYTGYEADVAEFNDLYMCDKHYAPNAVNKMGLGIDEIVSSTINFSRKNYADYFPENPYPDDVKYVGNSIKSKKISIFIEDFLDVAIRLLLKGDGQGFLELYYDYIDKIYNYRIPLKDIASKGKVKKYVKDYIKDCNTITKAGRPKSRQAWMELIINAGLNPDLGETIYYINIGKTKSQADVKKVKHYYQIDEISGEKKDIVTQVEKAYKEYKKEAKNLGSKKIADKDNWIMENYPNIKIEDEIKLNAVLLPTEIIESDEDYFCKEGEEYNVPKYIDMFNKRITPLLVCFSKEIRSRILITNPNDRQYFTKEESELCSGEPNKPTDQDTYEQLMTMEDKEIAFWSEHPEFEIPFLEECGMNWEEIVSDYRSRKKREKDLGIDIVRSKYEKIISELNNEEIEAFMEGELPSELDKIINVDPITGNFVSKEYEDIVIGTINDIVEIYENGTPNE